MDKKDQYLLAGKTGVYELLIDFGYYTVEVNLLKGDESFKGTLVCQQAEFLLNLSAVDIKLL